MPSQISVVPFAKKSFSFINILDYERLSAKLLEKDSYIETLEMSVEQLQTRFNEIEEKLATKEDLKDEADKAVMKLSDELRESASKLEQLSKETQEQENVLNRTQLSATTCMER